jgi:hypothetical protein
MGTVGGVVQGDPGAPEGGRRETLINMDIKAGYQLAVKREGQS